MCQDATKITPLYNNELDTESHHEPLPELSIAISE